MDLKKKIIIAILVVLLGIGIGIGIMYFTRDTKPNKPEKKEVVETPVEDTSYYVYLHADNEVEYDPILIDCNF